MNNFFTNFRAKTFIFVTILVFAHFSHNTIFAQTAPPKTETVSNIKISQIDDAKLLELLKPKNGKPLLINFWATWCDPCREEFPDLVKIENDYRGKIDVVTISLDDVMEINTTVSKFLTEMKAETQNFLLVTEDESAIISQISKEWSGGLPFTVFYNDKGGIEYFRQGKFKTTELREKIDSSIQKPVTPTNTVSKTFNEGITPQYKSDYEKGRADALQDISEGKLKYFTTGMLRDSRRIWSQILRERYQIQIFTTGCFIGAGIFAYNAGYNEIALPEIKKKFGENVLTETKQEAEKLAFNQHANVVSITLTKNK